MSDHQSSESEERQARHRSAEQVSNLPDYTSETTGATTGYSLSLLNTGALTERGNTPVRTAVMEHAQKTHGNQSVQRLLNAQRAAASMVEEGNDDEIARRIEAKSGNGGQLDKTIQSKLESSLGSDMSGVRVHTDHEADHLARSVQSVAFTSGQDIFFRSGAFDPNSAEGLKLLAHEATHTVQQAQGPVAGTPSAGGVSVSDPSDSFEQAAERAADAVASGGQVEGAGEKRRQLWDESPAMPAQRAVQRFPFYNPTPDIPLPFDLPSFHKQSDGSSLMGTLPSGPNQAPGPYAYARSNTQGGADGGFAAFHGEGNILGVPVTDDLLYGKGQVGAWDDGQGGTRYGLGGSAGVANWTLGNSGSPFQFQAEALTASAEASAGDSGATLGAQATLAGASATMGRFGQKTASGANQTNESQMRFGLSEGVGAAGRLHWGDSDKDGHREYGFGFDAGPVSFDYKTEDPVRSALSMGLGGIMGPGGVYGVDKGLEYLMGDTNMTDKVGEGANWAYDKGKAGASWLYDKGAQGLDAARDLGNRAYEGAGELWQDTKQFGSNAYDTASDYGNRAYDTASEGLSSAYDTAVDYSSRAVNTVSDYGNRAYNAASEGASEAWDTAKDYGSRAVNTVSDYGNRAYDTASGAYDTVSSGLSSAADWLTDW